MGIIKYRNSSTDPWVEIPALQGAKGDKGDMPDLTGYATTEYVDEAVGNVDIPDVSAFQTEAQVQALIDSSLASIGVAEEGEY